MELFFFIYLFFICALLAIRIGMKCNASHSVLVLEEDCVRRRESTSGQPLFFLSSSSGVFYVPVWLGSMVVVLLLARVPP